MTIIGIIVAFMYFDWPWRGVIIAALLAVDAVEIMIWWRWRKKRSTTGVESLIGARGKTLTDCRPSGQVRVRGETWTARSVEGIKARQEIEVIGIEGLELQIRPVS